jgi:hypothetical protein
MHSTIPTGFFIDLRKVPQSEWFKLSQKYHLRPADLIFVNELRLKGELQKYRFDLIIEAVRGSRYGMSAVFEAYEIDDEEQEIVKEEMRQIIYREMSKE